MEEEKKLTRATLDPLIDRAQKGDKEALKAIIPHFASKTLKQLKGMSPDGKVRRLIARQTNPESALLSQYIDERQGELLAESLMGEDPTPLERLLAEQVSLNWMALRAAEFTLEVSREISFKDGYWRQSRVDAAHNRLMASIRTLAQIRKLQLPNLLQVNIAEKQVNMAV